MLSLIRERRTLDIIKGFTTKGAHRDDFNIYIGDTQVIITCTDEIKDEFESKSVFYVNNGVIKKELD